MNQGSIFVFGSNEAGAHGGGARQHASLEFQVTRIRCGIAGFTDEQIAPMFRESPANCFFDLAWKPFLGDAHNYWGTY